MRLGSFHLSSMLFKDFKLESLLEKSCARILGRVLGQVRSGIRNQTIGQG